MKTVKWVLMLTLAWWTVALGQQEASADLLVYKGKWKAIEYDYNPADMTAERVAWNDSVYALIDVTIVNDSATVNQAYLYAYWKEGSNGYYWQFPLYNVNIVLNLYGSPPTACLFSTDLHNSGFSSSGPGSVAVEGNLVETDIGTNDQLLIPTPLKGKIIERESVDVNENELIYGDLSLSLDKKSTVSANQSAWSFSQLRDALENYLQDKGYFPY